METADDLTNYFIGWLVTGILFISDILPIFYFGIFTAKSYGQVS